MDRKRRRGIQGPLPRFNNKFRPVIADDLQLDDREPPLHHPKLGRRGMGKVENPSIHIGSPVINPDPDMLPI
jgi:hypothetical protein